PVGVRLAIGLRGRGRRTCRGRCKGVLRLLVRWPTPRLLLGLLGVRVLRGRLGREVGLRLREGILCLRPAEGLARLRVGVLGLGRGLRPRVRGVLSLDVAGLVAPGAVVTGIAHGPTLVGSGASLLPDAHADHDGRAGEAEVLPQATLDEAPIPVLEEPAGEDHEPWWPGTGPPGSRGRRSGDRWGCASPRSPAPSRSPGPAARRAVPSGPRGSPSGPRRHGRGHAGSPSPGRVGGPRRSGPTC